MLSNVRLLGLRLPAVCFFNTSANGQMYRRPPKSNPGLHRRLKAIAEDEPDLDKAGIDYESIEELEENIMEADHLHDEIQSQIQSISRRQEFKITQRKHFREPKEPSMLTWAEKEQIRFLHQSDSEKWNPDILAESFPVTSGIIKKIIKGNRMRAAPERVKAHDRKVSENWIAFHKGQLEVHDPELKAHLQKFTDRKNGVKIPTDEEASKFSESVLPRPKRTEFLSLITGFKATTDTHLAENSSKELEENAKLVKKNQNKKLPKIVGNSKDDCTLEQFQKRLEEKVDEMTDPPEDIKFMIARRHDSLEHKEPSEMYIAPSERYKTNAIVYEKGKNRDLTLIDPDDLCNRISIPKHQWKSGQVYRVKDSFYNDQGFFLYRVPGLKP